MYPCFDITEEVKHIPDEEGVLLLVCDTTSTSIMKQQLVVTHRNTFLQKI
jgi:hypothetical protein